MEYPNLVILGQAKAGTTSLHELLSMHSDIHANNVYKDHMFFSYADRMKNLPRLFDNYAGERYVLDTGATYCVDRAALEWIRWLWSIELLRLLCI